MYEEEKNQPTIETKLNFKRLAFELTRRGTRISVIENLLPGKKGGGPTRQDLENMQRHFGFSRSGRMPECAANIVKSKEERIESTWILLQYQLNAQSSKGVIDPAALCHLYDRMTPEWACRDVNLMWMLVRDLSNMLIDLRECHNCRSQYVYFTQEGPKALQNQCPHCELMARIEKKQK